MSKQIATLLADPSKKDALMQGVVKIDGKQVKVGKLLQMQWLISFNL